MRSILLTLFVCLCVHAAELELQPGTKLVLPSAKESAPLLAKPDEYLKRMSAFDRAARTGLPEAPTMEEFAAHAGRQTLDFTADDIAKITAAVNSVRPALAPLNLVLPDRITLVKTTGREDVNAPFCRGPIIIAPPSLMSQPESQFASVLIHEIFHVFSSHHPGLRANLYALLGFLPCSEPSISASLDARRFTNPDAMAMNFYTTLKHEDRNISVIPAMLGKTAKYDPAKRGPAFAQVDFVLLEVAVANGKAELVLKDGEPVSHLATTVPAYLKAMSKNTNYIWHPEEVLADNFVRALRPSKSLNAPELPTALLEVMKSAPRD